MIDTTSQESDKIIEAWIKASKDLTIEIETPFLLITKENGIIKYGLLIKQFGSKLGTLILTTDDMDEFNTAEKYGYYCSALNPYHYDKYDRAIFVDTLTDWGFYGLPDKKPDWYQGYLYNDNE